MITSKDITLNQVISFLSDGPGRLEKLNYTAGGQPVWLVRNRTMPQSHMHAHYAGRVAELMNQGRI
jgi:hypothetical protein